jgi:hypothetical protein
LAQHALRADAAKAPEPAYASTKTVPPSAT